MSASSTKALNVFAPASIMTYDKHMKIKTKKNTSGTSNNSTDVQCTDFTPAHVTWWKMSQVNNVMLWAQELSKKYAKQDTTTPSCEALLPQNESIMEKASEDEVYSTE